MYDLKITNGLLVDGTGRPGERGDLGVKDGRIAAVGHAPEDAVETVDAAGRVVSPGFIDIHTHLDAQVLWDRRLSYSPWHGVTTVLMGNCGFSIAPTRREHREVILRTLENVEGMSFEALSEGLGEEWGFETFPEYLDLVEQRGSAINVGVLFGHTPARYSVMGVEAALSRAADADELRLLRGTAAEALEAGAFGVSTSMASAHVGYNGRPVPSRQADMVEMGVLADALADTDRGLFQVTTGPGLSYRELVAIEQRSGRPVSYVGIIVGVGGPGVHRKMLKRLDEVRAAGSDISAQVSCRPFSQAFSLAQPFPFAVTAPATLALPTAQDLFQAVMDAANPAAKRELYRDPAFLKRLEKLTAGPDWYDLIWTKIDTIDLPGAPAELENRPLVEVADDLGLTPAAALLRLSLESDLRGRFAIGHLNSDLDEVGRLLRYPGTQLGLSDAGAHISEICDACFATDLLGRWVRERGYLELEEAVAMLTGKAADAIGLIDRGRLAEGLAADLVVFDPAQVGPARPELVNDLPGGAPRLVADALGIDLVVVNGVPIRRDGKDLSAERLPGRLLRSGG